MQKRNCNVKNQFNQTKVEELKTTYSLECSQSVICLCFAILLSFCCTQKSSQGSTLFLCSRTAVQVFFSCSLADFFHFDFAEALSKCASCICSFPSGSALWLPQQPSQQQYICTFQQISGSAKPHLHSVLLLWQHCSSFLSAKRWYSMAAVQCQQTQAACTCALVAAYFSTMAALCFHHLGTDCGWVACHLSK